MTLFVASVRQREIDNDTIPRIKDLKLAHHLVATMLNLAVGLTYYIGFEPSTGCAAAADAELRRWLECWTYQPASCGADPVTEVIEAELALPASSEWGVEPPCERETEVDPDPHG